MCGGAQEDDDNDDADDAGAWLVTVGSRARDDIE